MVSSPANYRTVSNLYNISKLPEDCFYHASKVMFAPVPTFNSIQSAYRTHCSTERALLHALNKINSVSDNSKPTILNGWPYGHIEMDAIYYYYYYYYYW